MSNCDAFSRAFILNNQPYQIFMFLVNLYLVNVLSSLVKLQVITDQISWPAVRIAYLHASRSFVTNQCLNGFGVIRYVPLNFTLWRFLVGSQNTPTANASCISKMAFVLWQSRAGMTTALTLLVRCFRERMYTRKCSSTNSKCEHLFVMYCRTFRLCPEKIL